MSAADATPKLNILVVEDDNDLRQSIVDALQTVGHRVLGVDCAEALPERFDRFAIDLVLLDLNLPGEDGISLAKRLRNAHPNLGIIMLSARAESEDRSVGYTSGADIYLVKPASLEELTQAILALARRIRQMALAPSTSEASLHLKGLVLSHGNLEVQLTKSEATLLAAFARAKEHILETWQIAEALGLDLDMVRKSLIELHVSRLRKKLPATGDVINPIYAIRGVGYQLCFPVHLVP